MPFQIHVILPADRHAPADPVLGRRERGGRIAAFQLQRLGDIRMARLPRRERVERVGQGVVLDPRQLGRAAGGVAGLGHHGKDRLAVILHPLGRKDGLVIAARRADVVAAGDVVGGQHAHHPGGGPHFGQVHARMLRMGLGRDAQIGVQRAGGLGDIVGVFGAAGHMLGRAVMRKRGVNAAPDGRSIAHGGSPQALRCTGAPVALSCSRKKRSSRFCAARMR